MKKVLATILFFVSLSASASNWNLIFAGDDGSMSYIDRETVVYYQGKQRGGWIKRFNTSTIILSHVIVNCQTRMLRIDEQHIYDYNNNLLNSFGGGYWQNAIPDTAGSSWVNALCVR